MKRVLPNLLTSLNLAIGSYGIFYVLTVEKSHAFYFVMAAAIFDFLDGFTARMLDVQSEVGKQLDSLADVVSFGLLPALFMFVWIKDSSGGHWVALLIVVFSALRLAIFNVDESQSHQFRGLPTPANAIGLTSLVFLVFTIHPYGLIVISIVSCVFLVAPIQMMALKFQHYGWIGNEWRWVFLGAVLVMGIVFQWTFLPFLIPFYVCFSLLSGLRRLNTTL